MMMMIIIISSSSSSNRPIFMLHGVILSAIYSDSRSSCSTRPSQEQTRNTSLAETGLNTTTATLHAISKRPHRRTALQ